MTDESRSIVIADLQKIVADQKTSLEIASVSYVGNRTKENEEWASKTLHEFLGVEKAVNRAIQLVNCYYDK